MRNCRADKVVYFEVAGAVCVAAVQEKQTWVAQKIVDSSMNSGADRLRFAQTLHLESLLVVQHAHMVGYKEPTLKADEKTDGVDHVVYFHESFHGAYAVHYA